MAKSLRMQATAEGVETRAQLDFLRRNGCNEVQGFLLARPIAAEQAASLLAESSPRAGLA
jgi:EAL domain-containing protein (putative c-di-GMP-specific phosphodiesterase class I)